MSLSLHLPHTLRLTTPYVPPDNTASSSGTTAPISEGEEAGATGSGAPASSQTGKRMNYSAASSDEDGHSSMASTTRGSGSGGVVPPSLNVSFFFMSFSWYLCRFFFFFLLVSSCSFFHFFFFNALRWFFHLPAYRVLVLFVFIGFRCALRWLVYFSALLVLVLFVVVIFFIFRSLFLCAFSCCSTSSLGGRALLSFDEGKRSHHPPSPLKPCAPACPELPGLSLGWRFFLELYEPGRSRMLHNSH